MGMGGAASQGKKSMGGSQCKVQKELRHPHSNSLFIFLNFPLHLPSQCSGIFPFNLFSLKTVENTVLTTPRGLGVLFNLPLLLIQELGFSHLPLKTHVAWELGAQCLGSV